MPYGAGAHLLLEMDMSYLHAPVSAANSHAEFAAFFGKVDRQFTVTLNQGGIEIVDSFIAENAYEAKVSALCAYPSCRVVDVGLSSIH